MSGTGLLLGQSGQSRLTDGKSKPKQSKAEIEAQAEASMPNS